MNLIFCNLCHGQGKLKIAKLGLDIKIWGLDLFPSINVGEMCALGFFMCKSARIYLVESYVNRSQFFPLEGSVCSF